MNGFRLTLLILLCLVVGLMAYVVFAVLPERESDFRMYNISQRNALYERQDAAHQERVSRYGADVEDPDVATARNEAAESDRKAELAVNEAEERLVIEEAKRREEAALAKQVQAEAQAPKALGRVASYNPEWNSILIEPLSGEPMNEGLVVGIRRNGVIVAEAQVDYIDESGQIGAVVKNATFSKAKGEGISADKLIPAVGDEVIVTPFATTSELRSNDSYVFPGAGTSPYGEPSPGQGLPEIDASLTPLP